MEEPRPAIRLLALTCGWLETEARGLMEGEPGRIRVPVPVYLIDHPRGQALFDSGLHRALQTDPEARIGPLARLFQVEFRAGEDLATRLAALEVDPARIRYLINSHLHFDHAGGNAAVPNAQLVVQRREWEAGADPDLIASNVYLRADYDLGHDVLQIDGEHDLFGDGLVVCVPTYGHTPGHQSLRVRLPSGEVVLTADACYFRRTLEELRLPPFGHDREAMVRSLHRLRAMRDAGARLFYGHDPELWADVPQAPQAIG